MTVHAIDGLTDLDRRIIVALQHDGRASWRAIAEIVGGTVATVTRRGQQLLADGVIRIAVLPALGSSGPVDAFLVRINCAPGTQLQVAEELVGRPDVRFITLVTGGTTLWPSWSCMAGQPSIRSSSSNFSPSPGWNDGAAT